MRLILVDPNKESCDVIRWQFRSHPEVQIICGRFETLPTFDCIVTAANSFGLMDAGIDRAVVKCFGEHAVQKKILENYLGEHSQWELACLFRRITRAPLCGSRSNNARSAEHNRNG